MSRTGAGWDLLAAAAVLAPMAALVGRRLAVPGALAGLAGFVVLLAAGAAPELGRFTPDPLALAAAAGTLLVTATLMERAPGIAVALGPAAAAVCFVVGLVDPPDLGSGPATVLTVGAAAVAAGVVLEPEPGRLLLPAVLLAALRGAAELAEPAPGIGLALTATAALLVLPALIQARRGLRGRRAGRGGPRRRRRGRRPAARRPTGRSAAGRGGGPPRRRPGARRLGPGRPLPPAPPWWPRRWPTCRARERPRSASTWSSPPCCWPSSSGSSAMPPRWRRRRRGQRRSPPRR